MSDKVSEKEIARQEKLNDLQERHGELSRLKNKRKREMNAAMQDITEINKQLTSLGAAIFDLKNIDGITPHITDHAVVRYLERVKGMNIWDIKAEIIEHRDAVRVDNVIVTVNGEQDEPV